MLSKKTIQTIATRWEMHGGASPSEAVLDMIIETLEPYGDAAIMASLELCSREVKGRLTPADIIGRIPSQRPSANEAWAMIPRSEEQTTVWTDEMRVAYGVAYSIMSDPVAARMAFIEAYNRELSKTNPRNPPKWSVSYGTDIEGRKDAVMNALNVGRLSQHEAQHYLNANPTETKLITSGDKPASINDVHQIVSELMKKLEA
jgi:hypothetical protein